VAYDPYLGTDNPQQILYDSYA